MVISQPFGFGSISLGLHAHDLSPKDLVDDLIGQALAAEAAGFDGVTLGEHHAGFQGYIPQTLQAIGWILQVMPSAWGAACPVLLTLRPTGLVVEEVAWLAARYPGRVGVGLAPGYADTDFEVAGSSATGRNARFAHQLVVAADALTGHAVGPLARDKAVATTAMRPVPVVSSAAGPVGARRAARAGVGIILGGFNSDAMARNLFGEYKAAGGRGPRILIRRAWVGETTAGAMEELAESYRQLGANASWLSSSDVQLASGEPASIAAQLASIVGDFGATCLNIRLNLPGHDSNAVREQIQRFGADVLPLLRSEFVAQP